MSDREETSWAMRNTQKLQREEFIEAVRLNFRGPIRADNVTRIVDRVITPALAFAWDEGRRAKASEPNPYQAVTQ